MARIKHIALTTKDPDAVEVDDLGEACQKLEALKARRLPRRPVSTSQWLRDDTATSR